MARKRDDGPGRRSGHQTKNRTTLERDGGIRMKMEITQQKENPLLKRTEVYFTINHAGEATPSKGAVVDAIVDKLKASKDAVVLDNVESVFGTGKSNGYAKVYESKDAALKYESEYLLKRNGISKPEYVPAPKEE
ncbi:MAG: 30S ribosomal protein S24e [Thermoplasmata archaeon]|nr:30S ribosomal protein S24e [Thermoplasmata archaeon]